jgi:hypothetical protein
MLGLRMSAAAAMRGKAFGDLKTKRIGRRGL